MGQPLSMGLRERVIAAIDAGLSRRAAAARYGIAPSAAIRWDIERRTTGIPTLHPGDVVIMDNLSSHKRVSVRETIEAAGAKLLFLPPYSPDFNPIEMAFAKPKALLRKATERTVKNLLNKIGPLVDCFTPQECAIYFATCGYDAD